MTLELYLFRHAESESNIKYQEVIGGRSDHVPLTARGEEQARRLGRRLHEGRVLIDEVYSSTALRAVQTATIALKQIYGPGKKEFIQAPELLELSQGEWEGRSRTEVYTPEVYKSMRDRALTHKAPGGESQEDVQRRALGWIEKNLMDRDVRVGIFSHGMTIKCILSGILKSDPSLTYRLSIDNASITHLRYVQKGNHRGWAIRKINDVSHLENCGLLENLY
jgi:broad specificity phosphatase PhoE